MSEEYIGASNNRFVSGNQFITVSDQLRQRIDSHDQRFNSIDQKISSIDSYDQKFNSIDQKINSIDNSIDFTMNMVGNLDSKSEKMLQAIDNMARTFNDDRARICLMEDMVDTDHYLYFDSLITRARVPQNINSFIIFVAPNGEVFWANYKLEVIEEFGLAAYFTEDQFIKLMQCEYKLEESGEYDCRWQMLFVIRANHSWLARSAYRLYNLIPVEGSSVGKSSYCYNEHPEECDYPLFPFDKPGYTDKEIEKICKKLCQNESYLKYSGATIDDEKFLVFFTTLKDGGYVEAIIENEFYKLGSKTCYYFN